MFLDNYRIFSPTSSRYDAPKVNVPKLNLWFLDSNKKYTQHRFNHVKVETIDETSEKLFSAGTRSTTNTESMDTSKSTSYNKTSTEEKTDSSREYRSSLSFNSTKHISNHNSTNTSATNKTDSTKSSSNPNSSDSPRLTIYVYMI